MALEKEKANENDLASPISEGQSEVCLEHQCSKRYLLSMLQDPPEHKHSLSTADSNRVHSQAVANPPQTGSVLLGLSEDGKHLLILPSNLKTHPDFGSTVPSLQQATTSSERTNNEKNLKRKMQPNGQNPELPVVNAEKVRKCEEGESGLRREREPEEMGARCNCRLSIRSKKFHCNEFTDEDRRSVFVEFWGGMNFHQRRDLVCSLVKCGYPSARRRDCQDPSRKEFAFQYHLKKNNELLRVCKVMFLTTLSIGDASVRDWVMYGMSKKPYVNL